MKLLLDTYVLLWWLDDNPRLKVKAKAAIADGRTVVFISAVVIWEIRIKEALGSCAYRLSRARRHAQPRPCGKPGRGAGLGSPENSPPDAYDRAKEAVDAEFRFGVAQGIAGRARGPEQH